jgi:hypothetical protein
MHGRKNNLVRAAGLEPARNTPQDFKSRAATDFAMPAWGEGGVSKSRPLGPQPSALPLSYQHHGGTSGSRTQSTL